MKNQKLNTNGALFFKVLFSILILDLIGKENDIKLFTESNLVQFKGQGSANFLQTSKNKQTWKSIKTVYHSCYIIRADADSSKNDVFCKLKVLCKGIPGILAIHECNPSPTHNES